MKRTSLLRGNNADAYRKYMQNVKIPFTMTCSNYTVLFQAEGLERKFVHNMQSARTFAAFAKLKSNLKDKPVPLINKDKLSYFVHDFRESQYVGDVYNIDLKSAYATILFKDGYINQDCFDYISAGTKQQRLASVGMLASRKQRFQFENGCIIDNDEIVSPYANFFFHAVKRTGEIMGDLKQIIGNDYLFTWVDGIYFQPNNEAMAECERYLQGIDYKFSTELLRDFNVKVHTKKVTVDFLKLNKKGEWAPKPFNLPLVTTEFKKLIVQAILNRKKAI